jgi:hypothetical protein
MPGQLSLDLFASGALRVSLPYRQTKNQTRDERAQSTGAEGS